MFVIKFRKYFLALGAIIAVASLLIIFTLNLNLGIDFTGGALTEVTYEEKPDKAELETTIDTLSLGGYSLRESVSDTGQAGYILRTRDLSEAERTTVASVLTSSGTNGTITRYTSIGPVIGEELKQKAKWAIVAVVIMIILYVAFAFRRVSYPLGSWVYGGITIVSLIHDVLVPTAMMSLLGYFMGVEIDVLFVMAILAILGYSVNDTIVIFDRVRENLDLYRQEKKRKIKIEGDIQRETIEYTLTKPFNEIVGMSVSQTMTRSLNTSGTTLIALIALYFVGGAAVANFALVLIVGIIAGTFSSICLANPLLTYIAERKLKKTE